MNHRVRSQAKEPSKAKERPKCTPRPALPPEPITTIITIIIIISREATPIRWLQRREPTRLKVLAKQTG